MTVAVPEWSWLLVTPAGDMIGEVEAARTRKVGWSIDGPASASFTMPGDHPQARLVTELEVDLLVGRDGVALFRGRLGMSGDTYSANVATCQFSAVDYRGMLDRRILWSDSRLSYRQWEQGEIAWDLIRETQARPGGNLGITRGTGLATGMIRDRDYEAGKKIGEALQQLGNVIDGFWWEIDAARRFNIYYPRDAQPPAPITLVYGQEISDLSRTLNPSSYANAIRFNGHEETTQPVEVFAAPGLAGRFEAAIGNPDLLLQESVQARAEAELAVAEVPTPGYHATLVPGWWTPEELWVRDMARVIVHAGRLDANADMRVVSIEIDLDDAGGESVAVSFGEDAGTLSGRLGDYESRIEVLERARARPEVIADVPVGACFDYVGRTVPRTFHWMDGALLPVAQYPELFAVIGYDYGSGIGGSMFALPDARGRATIGVGGAAGLTSRNPGGYGGAETVGLWREQNAGHDHPVGITSGWDTENHSHGETDIETYNHSHTGSTAADYGDHNHTGTTAGQTAGHGHEVPSYTINYGVEPGAAVLTIRAPGWAGVMSGAQSADHGHGFYTSGRIGDHTHAFGTGGVSGFHKHPTLGASNFHSHYVNGWTHVDGQGQPHENMPPWVAIGRIIRVLPPWRPDPGGA